MKSRQKVFVGDLFALENGFAFKSGDFIDQGVPVIKIKNVKAGFFSEHEFSYVSENFLTQRANKLAKPNDLLISMSGNRHDGSPETWVGKVAFFDKLEPYFLNQRVGALRLKKDKQADIRYLGYLLSSFPYQEQFISIATSSGGQANLSPAQILNAEIELPSIEEQRAIAAILGALDDKIELNRKTAATLEEMARALYRSWFVDFEPVHSKAAGRAPAHMDAETAALFPDRFGEDGLPEGWRLQPTFELVEFIKGRSYKSSELQPSETALVSLKSFQRGGGYRIDGLKSYIGKYKANQVVSPGELVISLTDVTQTAELIARATFARADGRFNKLVASLDVGILRPHEGTKLGDEFLHQVFNSEDFLNHALAHTSGTTVLHLAKEAIPNFRMIVPHENVRSEFGNIADPLREQIFASEQENQTLANLRDALLPRLVSGELRVAKAKEQVKAFA